MKNGLLYPAINFVIDILKYFNLVEIYKNILVSIFNKSNTLTVNRFAIDSFIILKWIFIICIIYTKSSNCLLTVLVWYLLYSNLYTYFYYHIWHNDTANNQFNTPERIRRRFINLLTSIGFSNLCFAYLYRLPYLSEFEWSEKIPLTTKAIWFSFANSLTANYEFVKPITKIGVELTITQLLISFIFLTMILGNSIPKTNNN
ncbi:hypothetical protein [Flavobacterium sp. NKUCC04_CG]|uniref:hypothetical protein n=1 Tax=Flavobacterium sp. NKUCC04_CG TaxID=2842121 RepID=UPI001C5AC98F|nr:hypothetical protein [Flavobacterium sp. NKUCC04_CG]MBW3518060.1 hypothetical protein [Flavobacterium sp. NKUCC04_CG]